MQDIPYYLVILSGLATAPTVDVTAFEGPDAKARCIEAKMTADSVANPIPIYYSPNRQKPQAVWPKIICKRGVFHK